jgi:Tol biopolymer transport system component
VAFFKDEAVDYALCGDAHFILDHCMGDSGAIWLSDMAGRGTKELTHGFDDCAADCSPDGKSVIFVSRVGSKYQLFERDTLEYAEAGEQKGKTWNYRVCATPRTDT